MCHDSSDSPTDIVLSLVDRPVELVSSVDEVKVCSVKTLPPRVSKCTVVSLNTSPSEWRASLASPESQESLPTSPSHYSKLYTFKNLTDEEATLLEPASCAIHGLDKLRPKVGVEVLLFGAGPTGLILAQLLKQNGARRVVIAAPAGMKMELAKKLNAGDEYVELVRGDKEAQAKQWAELKKNNPCKSHCGSALVGLVTDPLRF